MSRIAPLTRPPTATRANGTRNHVGSSVVSAPIGSAAMAAESSGSFAQSRTPYDTRITTGRLPPNVGQKTTPAVRAVRGRYRE